MSFDLWTHQYCLACDKQVHDGAAYCSESCRLSDFEKTPSSPSSSCSRASSPGISAPQSWAAPAPALASRPSASGNKASSALYLSPAYDFANAQPYGTTPVPRSFLTGYAPSRADRPARQLTPSSSHGSLCSMQSTASDASRLSAVAKRELQAYAVSFEQVRTQRRRSY